ncbi:D-tyrosyl-tRNA(Tyr) deacylase [Colwellia sp. BRX10-3]|uniref:D-aminoacyl-tRNA deacylase n=1 Tax=Colwellia sp. BRX10-3 TaxID=2759844 RepID=UPI0015F6F9C0|nr:D-aminoacyl-tRNA deacylase [Colwellia sp. BRX10-3]MBA6392087.1 D-tyrosyl-tRNA(Tyr) deacylase [Colwellia sp. BRX10-3]
MIALMQRVSEASVSVDNNVVGEIEQGLLVLLAIEPEDTKAKAKRLAERVAGYRIFADENGKMNFNVKQIGGEILVVSQFTLAANTTKGMRPSFTSAAPAELSQALYQYFCTQLRSLGFRVPTGVFGANMQVSLLNDGPVTINLQG